MLRRCSLVRLEQLRRYNFHVKSHGIKGDWTNWYLVLNMHYNDYYDTAKAFDLQDDPEFFSSLARDFIEDADAKPLKVEKYFLN